MSLAMLNDFDQHVLKTIGRRVVSLRLTLTNAIGGWALVSPSLRYRLHLINIQPHELDRLLRSQLVQRLHTLLVDVKEDCPFKEQTGEGLYLTKVLTR